MKLSNKQQVYISTVLVLLLLGSGVSVWVFISNTQVDLTTFTIAVLSALVSLVALFVALQTYISIDSVNNITKMDGNVLDNEYYTTSIPELIDHYQEASTEALCDSILKHIIRNLKNHSDTAVNFADTLQGMIDLLVLLPALDLKQQVKKGSTAKEIDWIIKFINTRASELQSINKGNSIQIREAVKLFMAVYEYQHAVENKSTLSKSGLLKVRVTMLRNPVSATIYYNYLGLYYRKRAMYLIDEKDRASVAALQEWPKIKANLPGGDLEKLRRNIGHAKNAFDKALAFSAEDPMWRGYILFNQARVQFIEHVFGPDEVSLAQALNHMGDAINARATLNELITEILGDDSEPTALQRHYLYQEEYARQLYVNYCWALGEEAMYRGEAVVPGPAYLAKIEPFVNELLPKNQQGLISLR